MKVVFESDFSLTMESKSLLNEKSDLVLISGMCVAEVLTMQGVFTFSSMLPFFFEEWALDSIEAGWISGIYYGAYMISVMILVSLTDWLDAKKIYLAGALVTLFSCLGFATLVDGFWSAIIFRTLGGIGLAGTYMPGLKALSDRLSGKVRARATSFYTSSFGIGSALSFLIGGLIREWLPWQSAFWISASCALVAFIIVWKLLENYPNTTGARSGLRSLDFRPVFKNPKAMGWIACYTTHNYELFAFRSWIVAFLAFALTGSLGNLEIQPSTIVFIGVLLGMPSSVIGNELAMRYGRKLVVVSIMVLSAGFSVAVGSSVGLAAPLIIALVLVYGCFVTGDSAAITTGVIESSKAENRGVTLAVHSGVGFIGSFLGPIGFGIVLSANGGAKNPVSWFWAFASTGAVLLSGPILLSCLRKFSKKEKDL